MHFVFLWLLWDQSNEEEEEEEEEVVVGSSTSGREKCLLGLEQEATDSQSHYQNLWTYQRVKSRTTFIYMFSFLYVNKNLNFTLFNAIY